MSEQAPSPEDAAKALQAMLDSGLVLSPEGMAMSEQDKGLEASRSQPCADASALALEACPFCGGEARLWMPEFPINADCGDANVSCGQCDAVGPNVLLDMDVHTLADWPGLEAEAVNNWNTRAHDASAATIRPQVLWSLRDLRNAAKLAADQIAEFGHIVDGEVIAWLTNAEARADMTLAWADGALGRQDGQLRDEHND